MEQVIRGCQLHIAGFFHVKWEKIVVKFNMKITSEGKQVPGKTVRLAAFYVQVLKIV